MVDRIKLILKVNNMTASRFADEIGVQRSSISHILSGRNLPSLDLIQKILKRYPEINSEWLLNGNGSMLRNPQPDLFNVTDENEPEIEIKEENHILESAVEHDIEDKTSENQSVVKNILLQEPAENQIIDTKPEPSPEFLKEKPLSQPVVKKEPLRSIEKIVIFYSDKTFREYFPE